MIERREPKLGESAPDDFDALEFRAPPRRGAAARHGDRHRGRRRGGGWLIFGGALLVGAVVSLYIWREPIASRLLPEPRQNQLMEQAQAALAAGRLSSPDGRGARELYTAVLALNPDRGDARDGLARVGAAALQRAREALARNDADGARDALALARSMALPAADLRPLEAELRKRDSGGVELDKLLAAARSAQRAGRIDGARDSALVWYDAVLAADPGNALALAGRADALDLLLEQARSKLEAGDEAAARGIVDKVATLEPGHPGLPVLRARLAEAQQGREYALDAALQQAEAALAAGQLDAAQAGFETARQAGADDAHVARGLRRIGDAHARRAERAANEFDFAAADLELEAAGDLTPDSPRLHAAEQSVLRSRARYSGFSGDDGERIAGPRDRQIPRSQRDRVERLLQDARRAEANGDLVEPPGDSAYDKLRAALALAPDDPRVQAAQTRLAPAAVQCFDRELAANRLGRAHGCLDALVVLDPDNLRLPGWRARLAERWLGVADERMGAGELDAARRAIDAARELDPGHPGLPAASARLEQADLHP